MKLHNFLAAIVLFTLTAEGGDTRTIVVNGIEREYIIYKPASLLTQVKYPVVLDFHGGGGNAASAEKSFGFDKIADIKNLLRYTPRGLIRDGTMEEKSSVRSILLTM